jgi:hypothetical protein
MLTRPSINSPSGKVRSTLQQLSAEEQAHANGLLADWVEAEGVQPYGAPSFCLMKVADAEHQCHPRGRCLERSPEYTASGPLEWFSVLDHPEWWQDDQGNFILTAHPYFLTGLAALFKWAEANKIGVEVFHPKHSWYWPGETQLIVVKRKRMEDTEREIIKLEEQ